MSTEPQISASRSEEVIRKHNEYLWPAVSELLPASAGRWTAATCNTSGISKAASISISSAAS